VPFGSTDLDPDSDVIALFSLHVVRFACVRCRLSSVGRTETETAAEMTRHFDAHRAAGDRVPESFYNDVITGVRTGGTRTSGRPMPGAAGRKIVVSRSVGRQTWTVCSATTVS
jgi:hypothetical protein